jgi:hypothetical protein
MPPRFKGASCGPLGAIGRFSALIKLEMGARVGPDGDILVVGSL